jgi:hypothetical protein
LLAPPPGEVIFTNHDDGIPGLTHVEITMRDAPVVSPSFFLAPMVILPPPSISLFTGPLLTEDFEAYATRAISDADLGAWSCYQIGLEAGTGHTGSKAAVSYQGALQHYVVNTPPLTRWGRTVVWAYRFSAAELTARGRDPSTYYHGINIQPAPTIGYAGDHSGFGVLNDTHALYGAGDPDDMVVWTYWRTLTGTTGTYTARASNVVVDSVWQKFDFRWKLSTVGTSGLFLEANGCVQLLVDDVVVLDLTGLLVTLADNTGPSVENSWDGVYYAFGGLVDDLSISNESAICPDGPPTEVIFTNDRTPGMTHIEITMSDEE